MYCPFKFTLQFSLERMPDLAVEHVKALPVESFGGCDIAADSRRGQSIGITWSFAGSQAGHQYGCVI
jgi:hypothetical protein